MKPQEEAGFNLLGITEEYEAPADHDNESDECTEPSRLDETAGDPLLNGPFEEPPPKIKMDVHVDELFKKIK